ncbi:protein PRRC1-like isoform X2 [Fopius arisanus]|uniref:Protein PRRC1-like isoform X2 n=1 Tax=Fopius arisanus TaxID=64838 RepID=A0A9R1TL32_9HYME|nr:PREDICTED: protein PRRC1-like isoform X2 [Fopius arisanus]
MTDESNGESTFEFVDKKEDLAPGDNQKSASNSSLSSSTSLLQPLGASSSSGNLLSNIAPPSALPSFVASPPRVEDQPNVPIEANVIVQTKQPQQGQQVLPSTSSNELEGSPVQTSIPQELGTVGGALFSWVKDTVVNNSVLNKVAERAKNSVNSMITTLDPQMHSGGDVEVVVACNKEIKVSPVREAFQGVFGKATVSGVPCDLPAVPETPVGFDAGVAAAEMRIKYARNVHEVPQEVPIVGVQSFLVEAGQDKWYELGVILLEDQKNNVSLQTFTQMTPVPSQIVTAAQEATPEDYPLKSLGLAVHIGALMATNLQVGYNEWHHALTGVSRRDTILLAVQSLAGLYKNTITIV